MTVLPDWGGATPRKWQAEAFHAVLSALHSGVRKPLVHAATGAGKSYLIAEFAAKCTGTVLVTTPTQYLTEQLGATLLARCPGEVGRAFQHEWTPDKRIVVTCQASMPELLQTHPKWSCWIVDEAHKAESDVARETRPETSVALGLTATPFRADARGLSYWDRLVYTYTSHDAVRDGVLVPWKVVRWDGQGDDDTDALCAAWVRAAQGPGIVSAMTVKDAEQFAALCGGLPIHGYLPRAEQQLRIRQLKAGRISCLVHVQLLSEGVDFPWLQWLCLRRPVASPVRLVQEVGRVLRAHPGKSFATLYDPHDLLGELGLVHAAALEDAQAAGSRDTLEPTWAIPELQGLDEVSTLPPAKAVDAISGWATDVLGALRGAGLADPPGQYEGGKWRQKKASEKQVAALGRLAWAARYLPDERHRRAVRWVLEQPSVRAGTASDLLSVLKTLATASETARKAKTHWHLTVDIPDVGDARTAEVGV